MGNSLTGSYITVITCCYTISLEDGEPTQWKFHYVWLPSFINKQLFIFTWINAMLDMKIFFDPSAYISINICGFTECLIHYYIFCTINNLNKIFK